MPELPKVSSKENFSASRSRLSCKTVVEQMAVDLWMNSGRMGGMVGCLMAQQGRARCGSWECW